MKSERILITLPLAELQELDKYSELLGASRSRLIQNALLCLFSELASAYPESSLGLETKSDGMD